MSFCCVFLFHCFFSKILSAHLFLASVKMFFNVLFLSLRSLSLRLMRAFFTLINSWLFLRLLLEVLINLNVIASMRFSFLLLISLCSLLWTHLKLFWNSHFESFQVFLLEFIESLLVSLNCVISMSRKSWLSVQLRCISVLFCWEWLFTWISLRLIKLIINWSSSS